MTNYLPALVEAVVLLREFVDHDDSPCQFDHHGYCQAHWGGGADGGCATKRARDLLDRLVIPPFPTSFPADGAAPRWADRVTEACAAIPTDALDRDMPDAWVTAYALWDDFVAASGWEHARTVEVGDPSTWHPKSPLYLLLRMAACGDLTPLADALAAARTPDPPPPPPIIQRIADLPETHYAIVGDLFYVCCDGPDDVWSRIRDLTGTVIDRPVGSIFRVDHNADDPATPTGWKVYAAVGRADVMVLEPRFVDYPSQLPTGEGVKRFAQLDWT